MVLYNNKKALILVLCSIISSSSVLIESNERIIMYSGFFFPRVIEGTWDLLEKLKKVKRVYNGEKYIFSSLIGILTVLMVHYKELVTKNYQYIYSLVFGNRIDKS
jgi:hypothetical protein